MPRLATCEALLLETLTMLQNLIEPSSLFLYQNRVEWAKSALSDSNKSACNTPDFESGNSSAEGFTGGFPLLISVEDTPLIALAVWVESVEVQLARN